MLHPLHEFPVVLLTSAPRLLELYECVRQRRLCFTAICPSHSDGYERGTDP